MDWLDHESVIAAWLGEMGGRNVENAYRRFVEAGLKRNKHPSRDMAAWLARRLSTATMRELASSFGLANPTSISNLTRQIDAQRERSKLLQKDIEDIMAAAREAKNAA